MKNQEDNYTHESKYNTSRSNSYQYKIREIQYDPDQFLKKVTPVKHSEQFKTLNDQAASRLVQLVHQVASKRQLQVFKLYMDGYTQTEIAHLLKINQQSSIQKTLFGNGIWVNGKKTNHYGGLFTKVKAAILNDNIMKQILSFMIDANDIDYKLDISKLDYPITIKISNINIYYLISTYFKSQQAYHLWINSTQP